MSVRAALFDIDGTLVDSNDYHVEAWRLAFSSEGINIPPSSIHAQIGKGADLLVPALLPGAAPGTIKRFGDRQGEIFKGRYLAKVKQFPAAHEILARTKASGCRVVLASSASKSELDYYIDLLNAQDLVHATTSIDDVRTSKPAPDIFAVALQRSGVGPEDAVAVGDSPYDIEAAGKCGVATIGLRSGGFADEVLDGAAALYDGVGALLAEFDRSPLGN